MKKNLKLLSILTLSAGLAFAAPVFGASRSIDITKSGISLDKIDAAWKEVSDQNTLHTFTNGTDVITVLRYDSDDTLPTPERSGGKYAAVFQTFYSAGNDVYVVTGSAVNKKDIDAVRDIMDAILYPASEGSSAAAGSNMAKAGSSAETSASLVPDDSSENHEGETENAAVSDSDDSYNAEYEENESYDASDSVDDPFDLYSWDETTDSFIPYQQAASDGSPIGHDQGWYYCDEATGEYLPW